MIKINSLNKYFNRHRPGEIHVINDTTIEFADTGLVCILGESGSGKTTLLNTIGGLDDFSSGSITVGSSSEDDISISSYSSRKIDKLRNEKYAYVFQNYYLLPDRTVHYNIKLMLDMYDLSDDEKEKRIDYVLEMTDMLKYKKRTVSMLSGGQQQRVAIARALVKTPSAIFADEPTGNLDEANTLRIMNILKKVSKECLVVLVTHERSIADFYADRIIEIEDGKIKSDYENISERNYFKTNDSNIYLGEYNQSVIKNDTVTVESYSSEYAPALKLRLIYLNGRYYIQAPDNTNVSFLAADSERKIIEGSRPTLTQKEQEEFEYNLSKLSNAKTPKLSLKEIMHTAFSNITALGKQHLLLIASFIVMAVLIIIAAADMVTLSALDKKPYISEDSSYLHIYTEKNALILDYAYDNYFESFYNDFKEKFPDAELMFDIGADLKFTYNGFLQIGTLTETLSGYSFADVSHLTEDDLIYGTLPAAPNEIVIDTWVLNNLLSRKSILIGMINDVSYFVGKELNIAKSTYTLKITGISDTGEPDIYIDKFARFGITTWLNNTAGLAMLKKCVPGEYDDIVLSGNEALVSQTYYNTLSFNTKNPQYFYTPLNKEYKIVGVFDDSVFPANVVVSDEHYDELLDFLLCYAKAFIVRTDDKAAVINYIKNGLDDELTANIKVHADDDYSVQYSRFISDKSIRINTRFVVTTAIFIASMLILYFAMKSNALKKIKDIGVYRLLGISKGSIIAIFALETALITTYTSVPAALITTALLKFFAGIPSLELELTFSYSLTVLVILALYAVNIIIGIIPIIKMLMMPPAKLAAKYDM